MAGVAQQPSSALCSGTIPPGRLGCGYIGAPGLSFVFLFTPEEDSSTSNGSVGQYWQDKRSGFLLGRSVTSFSLPVPAHTADPSLWHAHCWLIERQFKKKNTYIKKKMPMREKYKAYFLYSSVVRRRLDIRKKLLKLVIIAQLCWLSNTLEQLGE